MEMLTLIAILSCVMWYIIDRFKELWENIVIHKFITVAVAAVLALAVSFGYGLDIIFALGAWPQATTLGIVLTAFLLMIFYKKLHTQSQKDKVLKISAIATVILHYSRHVPTASGTPPHSALRDAHSIYIKGLELIALVDTQ